MKFINFNDTDRKLRAWENLPDFWKRGDSLSKKSSHLNENHTDKFSMSKNPTAGIWSCFLKKNVEFCIIYQKKDHGCEFICFVVIRFIFPGWSYQTNSFTRLEKARSNGNLKFYSFKWLIKLEANQAPLLHASFFLKKHHINILKWPFDSA